MNSMRTLLTNLNLIDEQDLELFSTRTRDCENINVLRGKTSGVIFIEASDSIDGIYESGMYRDQLVNLYGKRDFEITVDTRRRLQDYEQFYIGKKIVDFGCGEGSFIRQAVASSDEVIGVELQTSYRKELNKDKIRCIPDLKEIQNDSIDTVFCFHTLEHLEDPIKHLKSFKDILCPKGHLIIEVPHANDFLLRYLKNEEFKGFSLWSQHLILHSRVSLAAFLSEAGFNNFVIQARQRYSLSNHFNWIINGKAGGHKNIFSVLDTDELNKAYEGSLQMIDATDTLVAIVSN